jgi:HlyD family secretion protein
MRKIIVILIAIAVLAGGGYLIYRQLQAGQNQVLEILRQSAVVRGQIAATVSATGSIEPEAMVSLSFGSVGTVQQINVSRGRLVEAGDVLATLGTKELALAVEQAEDALRIQELTLEQARSATPSPSATAAAQADVDAAAGNLVIAEAGLAAAQATLAQALAQKAQLTAGATAAEIAAANAEIAARKAEMENLELQYNLLRVQGIGGPQEITLRFQLDAARSALDAAEARLALLEAGPAPAAIQGADAAIAAARAQISSAEGSILVAEANVARARAAMDRLQEGATEQEIAILEAQVSAAETSLALARLRLEQAMIVAPMAGRVASVLVNAGEQVSPGVPAFTIVNEEAFHIEVNVDEIDIDQIAVGQAVDITLDALPDRVIGGTIADIAPTAAAGGLGVVTYQVTINLETGDEIDLRPGMTANASIVVEEIADVLIVPNWAVRLDRETGRAFVNRLAADGTVEEVVIETGLRNEQFSELISGLLEGDVVVVTNERESLSFFGN